MIYKSSQTLVIAMRYQCIQIVQDFVVKLKRFCHHQIPANTHPIKQNRSSMFKLAKLEHPGPHSILLFWNCICKRLSSPTHLYSYCLFRYIEFGLHQVWLYELSGNLACLVDRTCDTLAGAQYSNHLATVTLWMLFSNLSCILYLLADHSSRSYVTLTTDMTCRQDQNYLPE